MKWMERQKYALVLRYISVLIDKIKDRDVDAAYLDHVEHLLEQAREMSGDTWQGPVTPQEGR
jgi:hypothetical protein